MHRVSSFIAATIFIVCLFASAARAEDWPTCKSAAGTNAIAACSRLISSGMGGMFIFSPSSTTTAQSRGWLRVISMEPLRIWTKLSVSTQILPLLIVIAASRGSAKTTPTAPCRTVIRPFYLIRKSPVPSPLVAMHTW